MKKVLAGIKSVVTNRIFITLVGVIALTIIIWFGGPLLGLGESRPLASETSRLIVLILVALAWGISNLFVKLKADKSNKEIMGRMVEGGDVGNDKAAVEEVAFLQGRMKEALQILKSAKLAQGKKLYSLPWYIVIGSPGSGKTTALNNSGLNFPLKEQLGENAIHGIGGTRNCDWWFTDKAILLDTAGRYTTQDSNAQADSSAWIGFLDILKRNRPRRPINGVLVTVSLTDLATQTATERNIYARSIKQRLQELHSRLGINFPIYVVFTKADLVSGFNEFFDDLSREEREQVWGLTFDIEAQNNGAGVVSQFNRLFLELIQRLNDRVYSLQNNERDPERRSMIYEFPKQLRALQDSMDVFLKEIFSPNKFEQNPLLRGVYIASATQEGTPIDKVIGKFAQGLGLKPRQLQSQKGAGKGYFIKRLFNDIIFAEQSLATANRSLEKRTMWIRRASIAACASCIAAFTIGWTVSFASNSSFVSSIDEHVDQYESLTEGGLNTDKDLMTLNAGLMSLRNLPNGFEVEDIDVPFSRQWGLDQSEKFADQADMVYRNAIEAYFVPYLASVLERQIANNPGSSEYLYAALKYYLMLSEPTKMEKEEFSVWLNLEWARLMPGKINETVRKNLMDHLRVALDIEGLTADLDTDLVELTRYELQKDSLPLRAYMRLKEDVVDISPAGFRLTDVINARKLRLFTRPSGKPMTEEIPGLFTYEGFYDVFQVEGSLLLKNLIAESWVYGKEYQAELESQNIDELYAQVEELYFDEYILRWRSLIDDLELEGFTSPRQGVDVLRQLTTGRKPIEALSEVFIHNLHLTDAPETALSKGLDKAAGLKDALPTAVTESSVVRRQSRLTRLIPTNVADVEKPIGPGEEVEQEFIGLMDFALGDEDAGLFPQMQDVPPTLTELEDYINQLSSQNGRNLAFINLRDNGNAGDAVIKELVNMSREYPRPFNQWLAVLASDTRSLTSSGAKQLINDVWKNTVLREYQASIEGRYPIVPSSKQNIKLSDFEKFFGYGGTMETFFDKNLADFVNKSGSTWRFKSSVGVKNSTLRQFQRADEIKRMFFKPGTQKLAVEFSLIPKYLDKQVSQFSLKIADQPMNYRHGPTRATSFVWPGKELVGETVFTFTPIGSSQASTVASDDPWSWFRLLDQVAQKQTARKGKINLKFVANGNEAIVDMQTSSTVHPFDFITLGRFKCPQLL